MNQGTDYRLAVRQTFRRDFRKKGGAPNFTNLSNLSPKYFVVTLLRSARMR